jgi:hypothetical protein
MTTPQYAPSTVTLTLSQDAYGNLSAATDLAAPNIGAPLTPVQALGLQVAAQLRHAGVNMTHGIQHVPALGLLLDIINPDQYGWQAPQAIRHAVLGVLHHSQRHAPASNRNTAGRLV